MTPSRHTDTLPATLDDRIRTVELRLIAREQRLWRGATEFQARARDAMRPRRWMRPLAMAGGVVLAGSALWWLLRRRRARRHLAYRRNFDSPMPIPAPSRWHSRVVAAVGPLAALPWAPLLSLILPLLPARLKQRATLSVALLWIARLASPHESLRRPRLWLSSLNGMWEGYLTMKQQRSGSPQSSARAGPG